MRRLISCFVALAMTLTSVTGYAQGLDLPAAGTMIAPSAAFSPVILRGMTVYPEKPLTFDFIVDTGDEKPADAELRATTQKLVNYFLAAMTVPEGDLWVNLSPVEKDRIITEPMSRTELGRDLLAQDYLLKQLTASLIYPENELGKTFWKRVYDEAYQKFGTTEIPVDTFNKVWIMPETASVYEKNGTVYVTKAHMKVMLASDYEALKGSAVAQTAPAGNFQELAKEIIREIVLPAIETEINEGRNFALLRQVFHSLILAQWYKKAFAESALRKAYGDRNKVAGIDVSSPELKEKIYQQYLDAYKKGVFNYIKEETDRLTNDPVPRKYFSGGFDDAQIVFSPADAAQVAGTGKDLHKAHIEVTEANVGGTRTVHGEVYSAALVENAVTMVSNGFGHGKLVSAPQSRGFGRVLFVPVDVAGQRELFSGMAEEFNGQSLMVGQYKVQVIVDGEDKGLYVGLDGMGGSPAVIMQGANRFVNWLRSNFRSTDAAQGASWEGNPADAAQADMAKVLYDGQMQAVTNPTLQKLLYNLQHPGTNKVASDVSLEAFLDPIKGPAQLALGKGGLGFLTGETWGAYSGLKHWNVMGVMPLYSLDRGDKEVDWDRQDGVQPVFVQDDLGRKSVLSFDVEFKGKKERVYIYWVNMNGMPVFVIKHAVLFRKLYPGGDEQAIQYGFLGRAYVELTKVLGVKPEVLRLSEPQLIFVITAMKNDIEASPKDSPFVSTKVSMTTHTPEAAALPVWHNIEWLKQLVGADLVRSDIIYAEKVNAAGAMAHHADIINGVSPEHKDVTIEAVLPSFAGKVTGIQNGSDPRLWRSEALNRLIQKKGIAEISGQELFDIGSAQKRRLNDYLSANGLVGFSDIDRPLFAALRRLVEYKSQAIFIPMIRWIVGDPDKEYDSPLGRQKGLGANLLLGGEALDGVSPEWMRQFKILANDPEIKGKFIVAERPTGTEFMQLATSGADSWLVMPWITREASGTSDQRAGFNGRVVIATATGGPLEWIKNGVNGWLINPFSFAQARRNGEDAEEFRRIVQVFQNREAWALTQFYEGGRKEFAQHMKELVGMYREPGRERLYSFMQGSFQAAHQRVSIHRMVQEYGLMFDSVLDGTGVRGFERKLQDFARTWDENRLWQEDGKTGDAAQTAVTPVDEGVRLSAEEQLAVFDVVSGRAADERYLIASTWINADQVKAAVQAKLEKQQVTEVVPVRSADVVPAGSLVIGPVEIHRLGQDNDLLSANYTVYDVRLDGGARFYVAFDFAQVSVSVRGMMDRLKAEGVAPLRKEFDEGKSQASLDVLYMALRQYASDLVIPGGEEKAKEILAAADFMKVVSARMEAAYAQERAQAPGASLADSVRTALRAGNPQKALESISQVTAVQVGWNSFANEEGGWAGERFMDANGIVPRENEQALIARLQSGKSSVFLVTKPGEGSLLAVVDNAMGGIDLNKIDVAREGELMDGVMTNKALEEMLTASPGLVPVIINITPIADILPILGLGRDGVSPVARAVFPPSVWGVVREEELEKV